MDVTLINAVQLQKEATNMLSKNRISTKVWIVVICCLFMFSSCDFNNKIQTEKDNVKEIAIEIIELIENDNKESLNSLFTNDAIETNDFSIGMDYTFDIYNGICESVNDCGTHVRDSFNSGKHTKTAFAYFEIITSNSEYFLYFEYFLKDESNNNQNKIQKLKVVEKTEVPDEYNYNYGEKYDRLGIYNPDWDTE